jgi:hypothetical protein
MSGLDTRLLDNGGPTRTHALRSASAAIDAGFTETCPAADQRGANRQGPCDIGAFEFGGQLDADRDTILDVADNCPSDSNTDQSDRDDDGFGDVCDTCLDTAGTADGCPDGDDDGVMDTADNCPEMPNPFQIDSDGDGMGDACQDNDGDGILDGADNCPLVANPDQSDFDSDGTGDACQDSDGDGVMDVGDGCPTDSATSETGACLFKGSVSATVNLRQGPGTSFAVVVALHSGDEFYIVGRNEAADWLRVRTIPPTDSANSPVEAWIFANLVSTDGTIQSLPVIEE